MFTTLAAIKTDGFKSAYFNNKRGMVLVGHVILIHHVTSPIDCSFFCTANDKCKSYNYKPGGAGDQDVCQLNNATRRTNPASYKVDVDFVHYFEKDFKSCLDYLRGGVKENGIYTITDTSGTFYQVFCDLTSEPRSAWTLILSLAFKNKNVNGFSKTSLTSDSPVQENNPNWEAYRLSLNRMQNLSQQSTHFRITTGFNVYGVDFRDYVRVKLSNLDVLAFQAVVEFVRRLNILTYGDTKGMRSQFHFGRRLEATISIPTAIKFIVNIMVDRDRLHMRITLGIMVLLTPSFVDQKMMRALLSTGLVDICKVLQNRKLVNQPCNQPTKDMTI